MKDSYDREAEQMLVQAIQKEPGRFAELYNLYYQRLFHFFYFLTYHYQDSEDLTSETFTRVWASLMSFSGNSSFRTWLMSISRKVYALHLREIKKTKNDIPWDENLSIQAPDNVAHEVEQNMLVELLLRKVAVLSHAQSEVLSYYGVAGLTVNEIAELMDKEPQAIRMLLTRGIKNLRAQMKDGPKNPKESDHE